ncbi:MAG: hypothetical protein IT462_15395 [Planctomycetes bacterium]|nr:hypothetical protein [Planctomycetota bacterium]
MKSAIFWFAALCLLAAPVFAQTRNNPAPDFKLGTSVTIEPEKKSLADCAGEVIFMDVWGMT